MVQLYTQLDSNLSQIRRLILQRGSFDDPLHGDLDVVSLDESPAYEALSYVWGPTTPPGTIHLSSSTISITPNLDAALRHLRHPAASRTLWVDALCINQANLDERAAQVALMRRVYAEAAKVLIWLGPAADGSDEAMRSVDRFDKAYWSTYDFQVRFMEILFRPWFTRIWTVQEFVMAKHVVQDKRMTNPLFGCGNVWVEWLSFITAWAHMDDLDVMKERYDKAYHDAVAETFRPEWAHDDARSRPVDTHSITLDGILTGLRFAFGVDFLRGLPYSDVQELDQDMQRNPLIWQARGEVMVHCRYTSAEAKTWSRRMELTRRVPMWYHGLLMHARRTIHIRRETLTLEEVLKGTMNLRSTDPRDKIYGILALLSDEARAAIPIDYHMEPASTFVPTMAHAVRREPGALALLGLLWCTRPFRAPLPSWVPDFTISADDRSEHSPVLLRGSCAGHDAWGWDDTAAAAVISPDLTCLSARRIGFGRVARVVSFASGDGGGEGGDPGGRSYYVARLAEAEALRAARAPRSEPLWRTVVGVRNTDRALAAWYPATFEVLMGRAAERDGRAQEMFGDAVLPIVRGRRFFVTDAGFAGVATPMVREGDMVALVPGMNRAAVLRDVDPEELGLEGKVEGGRMYQRITGFAYVGCHDREGFESLEREKGADWRRHCCLDGEMEECYII